MSEIPLGQAESETLEFKSARALEKKETIGREVVAMLNGVDRGEIWIGLAEEAEIAVRVEPIEKPELQKRALEDSLIDSIEPTVTNEEVKVESVASERGEVVLRIQVRSDLKRRPYALAGSSGARTYVVRTGARTRPMARKEIAQGFQDGAGGAGSIDHLANAIDLVAQEGRKQFASGCSGLWVRLWPERDLEIDLQSVDLMPLLQDPIESGSRRVGPEFTYGNRPKLSGNALTQSAPDGRWKTRVHGDGGIEYLARLSHLQYMPNVIHPYDLLELPISICRLQGAVLRTHDATRDLRVVANAGIFGLGQSRLGRPQRGHFDHGPETVGPADGGDSVFLRKPLVFKVSELIDEPDRCGFRLVRELYQGFGLGEEYITRDYDRSSGRLLVSD